MARQDAMQACVRVVGVCVGVCVCTLFHICAFLVFAGTGPGDGHQGS